MCALNEVEDKGTIDLHKCGQVPTAIAVIWSRENCYEPLAMEPVIAFHDELVGTDNKVKSILTIKFLSDIMSKCIACSTRGDTPTQAIVRVAPHEITYWSLMWDFVYSIQTQDLIYCVKTRGKTSVWTKDTFIDCGSKREIIK